jgi:hypothetical protein
VILTRQDDRARSAKAYALIKFFSDIGHAQQFLDGDLFMRRLSYFRRQEDAEGRWDSTEGVWAWLQKRGLQIRMDPPNIGPIHITERDLAAPVSMSLGEPDDLHIFCMYAYYVEEARLGDDPREVYGEDRLADLELALQVDPRCLRFGPHAVIVPYGPFVGRLSRAARGQSLGLRAGLVRYYDDEVFNGEFKLKDVPFRKQKRFDYQREFRICVRPGAFDSLQRTINIGSLRDIAAHVPSEHLLNAFKISLADQIA